MNKTQRDLLKVCKKKHFTMLQEVKEYAEGFAKYDNMTYRQIDEVFAVLKQEKITQILNKLIPLAGDNSISNAEDNTINLVLFNRNKLVEEVKKELIGIGVMSSRDLRKLGFFVAAKLLDF